MGKRPCRGRAGGQGHKHVILKRGGQSKVGYYQGAFYHGKPFAALGDTLLTESETETLLQTSKNADRTHANALTALRGGSITLDKPPGVPASTSLPVASTDLSNPTGVPAVVPDDIKPQLPL